MQNRGLVLLRIPLAVAVMVVAGLLPGAGAIAQSSYSATKDKSGSQEPNRLSRVHARKLDGFELSSQPSHTGTQIGGASRGGGADIVLLAPNKGRAYTLNPLFQWTNPDGKINAFEFRLLGPDGETVLYKAEVTGTSFKYPLDAPRPLKAGGDYFWTVGPLLAGEPADPAELIVVGGEERSDLTRQLDKAPEGSPARAETFVEKRLWYDAIEAYTNLIAEHPGDRQLLLDRAELYAQLPQTQKAAEQDRAKAETTQR
jgi:hypothetical protein